MILSLDAVSKIHHSGNVDHTSRQGLIKRQLLLVNQRCLAGPGMVFNLCYCRNYCCNYS